MNITRKFVSIFTLLAFMLSVLPKTAYADTSLCRTTDSTFGVNLRSGASTSSSIVGTLQQGQIATVISENQGNWWLVEIDSNGRSIQGWIAGWVSISVPCRSVPSEQSSEDCWISAGGLQVQGPDAHLQGRFSPEKLGQVFEAIGKYVDEPVEQDMVYVLFVESFVEAHAVFPEWQYNHMGMYGKAHVAGCDVAWSPTEPDDASVIVVLAQSSIVPTSGSMTFEIIVHEMSHSYGIHHGNWSSNAYFWGLIGRVAYEGQCFYFDTNSPELQLCTDLQDILYP